MQGVLAARRLALVRLSRFQRLAVMVGVGLFLAYFLSWSGIVQTLELATYDLRLWLRGPRVPPSSIVIVALNDESFDVLQQNIRTWRRTNYARLIDTLANGQPAVIGLDVAWIHPRPA
jgi:CHASE2 domain-containing sensor protein